MDKKSQYKEFAGGLCRLVDRGDAGALAALRRSLSFPPGDDTSVYSIVAPIVAGPVRSAWEKRGVFLTAGLFALWHRGKSRSASPEGIDLGAAMRRAFTAKSGGKLSDSDGKRFSRILASDVDEIGHHLRSVMEMCRTASVAIDWGMLAHHLDSWSHPSSWVQRVWAESFWMPIAKTEKEKAS